MQRIEGNAPMSKAKSQSAISHHLRPQANDDLRPEMFPRWAYSNSRFELPQQVDGAIPQSG